MGFMNIIKRFFSSESKSSRNVQEKSESLDLSSLKINISKDLAEREISEKKSNLGANKLILEAILGINECIEVLKKVDLSKRKENEKIKLVVIENLNQYTEQLERLKLEFEKLDKESESYLESIEKTIENFARMTKTSYEKATILIGKELEETREVITGLVRTLKPLVQQKSESLRIKEKLIKILEEYLKLEENEFVIGEIEEEIRKIKEEVERNKNEAKNNETEKLKLESGSPFKKELESKLKKAIEIQNLDKEIARLKEKADIKAILNKFHNDKKKMSIIKKYDENFRETLVNDDKNQIITIADEIGIDISELKEIKDKLILLQNESESEVDRQIKLVNDHIKRLDYEKEAKEKEITEKLRKISSLNDNNESFKDKIKKESEIILNVDVKL